MAIHVKSEIGKLKKVMLHRPGQELEHLVPEDLERLLFDDIPYLKTAKIEHDMFAEIMRGQGVEVVYLEDLTADVLKNPEKKEQFVREFIAEGGASAAKVRDQLYDYLMKISDEETELLTGKEKPEEAAEILFQKGVKIIAVTLGSEGAYLYCKEGGIQIPGFASRAVDTNGAGDSFWGGFLYCISKAGKSPEMFGIEELKEYVRFGNAVASLCVEKKGAIPAMPTLEEVEKKRHCSF